MTSLSIQRKSNATTASTNDVKEWVGQMHAEPPLLHRNPMPGMVRRSRNCGEGTKQNSTSGDGKLRSRRSDAEMNRHEHKPRHRAQHGTSNRTIICKNEQRVFSAREEDGRAHY